jgi:hypothetical protein
MATQEGTLTAFSDHLAELVREGEDLLRDSSLGLDERAIAQRAVGYVLEAQTALQQHSETPS